MVHPVDGALIYGDAHQSGDDAFCNGIDLDFSLRVVWLEIGFRHDIAMARDNHAMEIDPFGLDPLHHER